MKNYETEEIVKLLKKIPKELKKDVRKLMELSFIQGERNVLYLCKQLGDITPGDTNEWNVVHDSDCAGG